MAGASAVLRDLDGESEEVDALVADLDPPRWSLPTPAPGWTIAHQIAHLVWTDAKTLIAVRTPDAFAEEVASALAGGGNYVDEGAEAGARTPPDRLLETWRRQRRELGEALRAVPSGTRLPWFGPPMSAASMASARLMETWAHGQDIADALGVRRAPTGRLWHVARLGVRTRDFAFGVRGLAAPTEEFRVELTAPDGDTWTFGPEDAAQRVTGSAHHFCLLVTQRVHRADTDLRADGEQATAWLDIAQAFAGPPGPGRAREGTRQ
ncbi:TIGR03084 family metal-binding protein [Saccharomonospora cyanea]|uniref:TIGR03084 family protein n=1 Tax=Saccharomonospora cyanea NA-134 TaxID=882082 RepID=H5XKQ2_9PSEU|nr:TIGR03084 family metal-binding protein [Saccharomonospora cyanea]EHR60909.1 TIGR03084 family protein [Saccharomonospora cyanea NA-134]